jgi:hypothetical protein
MAPRTRFELATRWVRTEGSGLSTKSFRGKHWVFARFVSGRLLRIPRLVLRFYYVRLQAK